MSEKQMVTYEIIGELQKTNLYKIAMQKGIISTTLNFRKYVYEVYKNNCKPNLKKTQIITNTAEDLDRSESYIYKVIAEMES